MDPMLSETPEDAAASLPTREELQAELLPLPDKPDQPALVHGSVPVFEQVLAHALSYVRGKRGADLLAVILVGSGARRAFTPNSDIDLIVLVKGRDEADDLVRVGERVIEILYRDYRTVEADLAHVPRLPPLLRKARILYDTDAMAAKLLDKANQRFRQGPPPLTLNEKIRLRAEHSRRLGKVQDLLQYPATAEYLLTLFFDDIVEAAFQLRGLWPTAPADTLRFLASRDAALVNLLDRFLTAPTPAERLAVGREILSAVFQDIPLPPRID